MLGTLSYAGIDPVIYADAEVILMKKAAVVRDL